MKNFKFYYNNIDVTFQYKLSFFPQTKHNKFKVREKKKEIIFDQLEKQRRL